MRLASSILVLSTVVWSIIEGVSARALGQSPIQHGFETPGAVSGRVILEDTNGPAQFAAVPLQSVIIAAVQVAQVDATPLQTETDPRPMLSPPDNFKDRPLPEPASFLQQAVMTGDRYAGLRKAYVCHIHLSVQPSKMVSAKSPRSQDYDFFYLHGKEVHSLIALNDRPLSEAEKAQDRQRLEEEASQNTSSDPSIFKAETLASAALATDVFTDEKRFFRDGRAVIWFRFKGDRRRTPRTLIELIANALDGTVEIDEQDHAIVSMHGMTRDDLIVDHRLLIPRRFNALVYEGKRINDEMYVPSLVTMAVATWQPEGVTANSQWKRSLELRTYTVSTCEKFRTTSTILP